MQVHRRPPEGGHPVSMKSGLEDRNNRRTRRLADRRGVVSMKSGLEDRNNPRLADVVAPNLPYGLNEVRPGRPEQFRPAVREELVVLLLVSMKSGLEDRNNQARQVGFV